MVFTYIVNGKFKAQNLTGVQRVAFELSLSLCLDEKSYIVPNKLFSGKLSGAFWEQVILPLNFLWSEGSTLLSLGNSGPLFIKNQVVFIHDVAFLYHPKWFSKFFAIYYRLLVPMLARRCKKIITCSEFSKKEIIKYLGVDESKVSVVYNGISTKFLNSDSYKGDVKVKYNINKPYVLSVGSIDPRKNLDLLLETWAKSFQNSDYELLLIGAKNKIFQEEIKYQNINNVRWLGYVSDDDLIGLYKHSHCFVYPSLYEGFGLPPLEAMACGSPAISSDAASLPEAVGDAALLFKSGDAKDLGQKLAMLLNDEELRQNLIIKGKERSSMFTWEKAAGQFKKTLDEIK